MTDPVSPTPAPANNVPAIVRTVVPIIVGTVISWLLSRGFDLTQYQNAVNAWLIPVVAGLYYALFKWLESRWPFFGWFLGLAKQPLYVDPKTGDAVFAADAGVGSKSTLSGGYTLGGKPPGVPYNH
jgi:hypothetical protein